MHKNPMYFRFLRIARYDKIKQTYKHERFRMEQLYVKERIKR